MICCTECFNDKEVKGAIQSLNHKGTCPLCGTEQTWIYDSDTDLGDSDFEELLISIIEIYKFEEELSSNVPIEALKPLEEHMQEDWNIFQIEKKGIRQIIEKIIETSMDIDERILSQNVAIPELYDESYLEENSIFGKYQWDDFKKYLRNENRFHSKYIKPSILEEVLKDTICTIQEGTAMYRARVAETSVGYTMDLMGAPPPEKATAGRANSKGISCLYLASDRNTTVKEIRAGAFDFVTIATFKLKYSVNLVDLSVITHNSPFYAETDKVKYLLNERHLKNIEKDLAKPVSKRDSDLDYLPTQYISDFAKYLGYDGVRYISTFNNDAYNVALFDSEACNGIEVKTYLIGNLEYELNDCKQDWLNQ